MSRLGKKPIVVPNEVEVRLEKDTLFFKGKKGELTQPILPFLKAELKDQGKEITVTSLSNNKQAKANWGTMVALVKNAIEGVDKGFSRSLIIEGVGFRANLEGGDLVLLVGFSHPVKYHPLDGVTVSVDKNVIKVDGINKHSVSETAAQIRRIKKPEPYKGKGIHYEGEVIRRKAGKKAATAAS